jgi:RHS repeat-associated protein
VLGNVSTRNQYWSNAQSGFSEGFDYDAINRLHTSQVSGQPLQVFDYDAIGNISSKTGVGTGNYVYPSQGANSVTPHGVASIPGIGSFYYDLNGNLQSGAGRSATWTSFDMPLSINNGSASSQFVYGPEHQRTKQTRGDGSVIRYAGAMEIETSGAGTTVKTYWPMGLGVEIDKPSLPTALNWTHADNLGSVVGITDQTGALIEKMGYDAWGKRRTLDGSATPNLLDGVTDNKGFTGHEMLDQLDLVHMNGRVYDPQIARFASADPFIQDPEHSQSYNRYTYVWNNPTNLTDPTGFIGGPIFSRERRGNDGAGRAAFEFELKESTRAKDDTNQTDTGSQSGTNGATVQKDTAKKEPRYVDRVATTGRGIATGVLGATLGLIGATLDADLFVNFGAALYDNPTSADDFQTGHNFGYFLGFAGMLAASRAGPAEAGVVDAIPKMMPNDGPQLPKWGGPTDYSSIKEPANVLASTKPTTRQVREMKALNRNNNSGTLRDDVTGELMVDSMKSMKNVTPPRNEAQVDHIKPTSKAGTREQHNLNLRTRENNREKSNLWSDQE